MEDQARHRHRGTRWACRARRWILILTALTTGIAACSTTQPPPGPSPPSRPAQVLATKVLSPRVRDLVIDSPALGRQAKVRLLLPRRFGAEPHALRASPRIAERDAAATDPACFRAVLFT